MKKYLVFGGSNYYPGGGVDDFYGDFDSKEEAKKIIEKEFCGRSQWWQIVDYATMKVVDSDAT